MAQKIPPKFIISSHYRLQQCIKHENEFARVIIRICFSIRIIYKFQCFFFCNKYLLYVIWIMIFIICTSAQAYHTQGSSTEELNTANVNISVYQWALSTTPNLRYGWWALKLIIFSGDYSGKSIRHLSILILPFRGISASRALLPANTGRF